MNLCDDNILRLISAANDEKCDCYFSPDVSPCADELCKCAESVFNKAVIILPGTHIIPTEFEPGKTHPDVIFETADVLSNLNFWEDAVQRGVDGIILLGAETTKRSEYGHMRYYTHTGDIRASSPRRIGLVALFSDSEYMSDKRLLSIFGSSGALTLGECSVDFNSEIFLNERSRTDALVDLLSEINGQTAVFCSTRRDVLNLSEHLKKANINNLVFHGGLCEDDKVAALTAAAKGAAQIIITTKSFLQYSPFIPPLRTISCGVPYSLSHAARITTLSHSEKRHLSCFFCKNDVQKIINIGQSYAAEYTDSPGAFIYERKAALVKLLRKII